MRKRKFSTIVLSIGFVSLLSSCDFLEKLKIDTIVENKISDEVVKEAYEKLIEPVNDLYFYDATNKGYWIIEDKDNFIYLGEFNDDTFTFKENDDFYFDLVSSDLSKGTSFNDASKVIINKDTLDVYSELIAEEDNSFISEVSNLNNYDRFYYYERNEREALETNLKFYSYEFYSDYTDKLIDNYKNIYGDDLYSAFRNLEFKGSFNNEDVKVISDISSQFKKYVSSENLSVNIAINEGIEKIGDNAFKDFKITSELIFPESIKTIENGSFENSTIYRLVVSDHRVSFVPEAFKNALILNLAFKSYLNENYSYFPYSELTSDISPYIVFGLNLRKYNSISEGLVNENVINPLSQIKLEDYSRISDPNLTSINTGKTLFLAHNLINQENKDLTIESIREYNSQRISNENLDNFKNTVTLKLETDLTVYGSIYVGGIVSTPAQPNQGFISGDYASIDLNGHKLVIENGGLIDCSGLIFDSVGTGNVEIKNGGELITNFVVNDFYGGTNSSNKYFNNETPFMLYKLPYLKTSVTIRYGAKLNAHCVLYALSNFNTSTQTIVGENGLIELKDSESFFILEDLENEENFKQVLKIYGNTKTNAMSINIGTEFTTANVYFPISKYLDIEVYRGSLEITNKFKILPGSNINFYNDSSLIVSSELFIASELPKKENLAGINQYPDYYEGKEISGASVNFLDNSKIIINKDINTGLAGEINFRNNSNYGEIKNTLICETKLSSPLTSTEGTGYYGENHIYHIIKSYTKEITINNLDENNKIDESISKSGPLSYISSYENNEVSSISAYNSLNNLIGNYENNLWKINVDGELIEISNDTNRLDLEVIDKNNVIYNFIDNEYKALTYDEDKKIFISGNKNLISVDYKAIEGSLNERNLFKSIDNKYYFYVDETSGWMQVDLYENGNIIARKDNSRYPNSPRYNHCYFYDKENNSYIETDYLAGGIGLPNSNYYQHTFKHNNKTYIYNLDDNMIEITTLFPANNEKYLATGVDNKDYVYLNEKQCFISEDNFKINEETLTYEVTLNGETKTYAPICIGDLGLIEGTLIKEVSGITFFKFNEPTFDGAHTANFALRGGDKNQWYMASVTSDNHLVYYTQPNASSDFTYEAILYKNDNNSYELVTQKTNLSFTMEGEDINVYNYKDSGLYTIFTTSDSLLNINGLDLAIKEWKIIKNNILYYDNKEITASKVEKGIITGSDGNLYNYVDGSFYINSSYKRLTGFSLVRENDNYPGLYDIIFKQDGETYSLLGGYLDSLHGDFGAIGVNSTSFIHNTEYNYYDFGQFNKYIYADGIIFADGRVNSIRDGSINIINSLSDYKGYTIKRDEATKEWHLIAP
ncbi:MAG: hypothetical protein IAC58_03025 [Firmicutes bacterium]|uniref:Uncharacterized protein n=1 Tax=Candidatus Onthovivens merdipullorum TaxID=2840889 RepID=A0A9D9DJX6_9BACL|nr:hypothetical protein [Candidatus Onthovivens merdipullorum]